jgi:hypothetical protein
MVCDPCLEVANPLGQGGIFEPGFAFDPIRDRFVLFGGEGPNVADFRNDVWEFAGSSWSYLGPAGGPSPRAMAQLVYDPILGGMRMLGGYNANAIPETWTYVDGAWALDDNTPRASMTAEATESTYDSDHQRVLVLEDSANALSPADGLWVHDASGWQMLCKPCTTDGTPRIDAALVHVSGYDQTFLIGGRNNDIPDLAGTWVLVDDHFEPYMTLGDLPPRVDAGVAYDPVRDVVVLYGGWADSLTDIRAETWELARD